MVKESPENKLSQVGTGGWLDQVGIKLSQLSTKLESKLKLSLAISETAISGVSVFIPSPIRVDTLLMEVPANPIGASFMRF